MSSIVFKRFFSNASHLLEIAGLVMTCEEEPYALIIEQLSNIEIHNCDLSNIMNLIIAQLGIGLEMVVDFTF